MHVAICDDNVADRKQLERLMGREADKWIAKGDPLYIYTYGSAESIMAANLQFDAIIIDITENEKHTTLSVIDAIREQGEQAVMVISSRDDIDAGEREDIMYLPKAVSPTRLHEIIESIRTRMDSYVKKIELRGQDETLYVTEDDILWAKETDVTTEVKLKDGRKVILQGTAEKFYGFVSVKHECFMLVNMKCVINCHYIQKVNPLFVLMQDGRKFSRGLIAIGEFNKKEF